MLKFTYLLALALGLTACSTKKETAASTADDNVVVGANQEEHGCNRSAGYQWSAVQKKCIRLSEAGIKLAPAKTRAGASAYLVFASPDEDAQAEIFLPGESAGRLLTRSPGDDAGTWLLDTLTLRQWKGMYMLTGPGETDLYEGSILGEATDATTATHSAAAVAALLQGSWQAVDDPKSGFVIRGSILTTSHEGQQRVTSTFTYVADCGGTACNGKAGTYGCFTTAGEFDIDCQGIVNLSATVLEVTQGSTGKTIRYRRPQ
jgi:hypothetical protein